MKPQKITGYLVFGPDEYLPIGYTPTPEQIADMKKLFGWDYLPKEEKK